MKVNVSVEATAQEMREFLGLPNVQPLHDDILKTMRDNVKRGAINFDTMSMLKPLLPAQFHSMDMVQKFWEAFAKAGGMIISKEGVNLPETPDQGESRNGAEKSA